MELAEELEQAGEPVVVFSAHRDPVEAFGSKQGWDCITGSVSHKRRGEIVDRFQKGALRGVALTIGAGREGINLFRSSHMIFVDLDWTPAHNIQAEDRIHRIGQKRACMYTVMVIDHSLEYRLGSILYRKEELFNDLIEEAAK